MNGYGFGNGRVIYFSQKAHRPLKSVVGGFIKYFGVFGCAGSLKQLQVGFLNGGNTAENRDVKMN